MGSELEQYVHEQKNAGYSNEYIREQLRTHGWEEEDIATAFNSVEEGKENNKWTAYTVGSIIFIFVFSLAMVGAANITGFVGASGIACVVENPQYPGYFDIVENPKDCLNLMLDTQCEAARAGMQVENNGKVIFEAKQVCRGKTNLYF